MQSKPGIISYGAGLPLCRLAVEDVVSVWKNTELAILTDSLGVQSRTVLQPDEDTITLSADACRHALRRSGTTELDAIYLGTCTNPYDSRSSAAIVLEMLGTGQEAFCADVQFSGKSGTSAMQLSYAMVKAGLAQNALAIGADTISRHTAPGDLTEAYAGAGAVAVLFGTQRVIAELDATFSVAEDLADNIRPQGDRYIRSGMGLGSDKNNLGIHRHLDGITPADIDVAQVYDQLGSGLIQLESLGVCKPGQAGNLVLEGGIGIDGLCPLNTDGGNIGRGHASGCDGIMHIVELWRQMRGESANQVKDARIAVSQNVGGYAAHNSVIVLTNQ